ncbi:antibiotic biosynthesis monooxygenase [Caulobacter radicis]|uniref:putative quinol monooxygenase n=1 Tax=Caulobacter radicis TaxID=2172650 RepID=UPI000D587675|nr:putative quinol monooxygenase [Caulobacter radicis]PVM88117.1 antibiotic biosynthesis monooxygenase [Caulobacter radicis]
MSNSLFGPPLPDAGETGPYALVGTARARPGMADQLEARLVSLVEPTRQEAGCVAYHVHRDRADRDLFVFYEAWSDRAALLKHFEEPYILGFLADRADYLDGELKVRWLRMSSPAA